MMTTKPSFTGDMLMYFSVASSILSPTPRSTGVLCVWKPVIVLGLPAWPTVSTAWPTWQLTGLCFSWSFPSSC